MAENNIISTLNHIDDDLYKIKIRLEFLLKQENTTASKKILKTINKYIDNINKVQSKFNKSIRQQIK